MQKSSTWKFHNDAPRGCARVPYQRLARIASVVAASVCPLALREGPEEALVLEKWTKAFTDSDVDGIVKLYAADALFLGTSSKTVVIKPEGIRNYFEAALLNNRLRSATLGDYAALTLSDTSVVITGLDTVTGVRDGKTFSAVGRVTFIVAKRDSDWQIVHFYRSAMPN
jgi:uncharacterized protein (TIGR02246 family)